MENSFIHGIDNPERNIMLYINIDIRDGCLIVEIGDNGKGIYSEKLSELKSQIQGHKIGYDLDSKYMSGLMMVHAKLDLYYDNNFTFDIESKYNEGTKTTIILPIIDEGHMD